MNAHDNKHSDHIGHQSNADADINFWGDVFERAHLSGQVTFEEFLKAPWDYLRKFGQEDAPASIARGYEPLLPAQVKVIQNLHADWHQAGHNLSKLDTQPGFGESADHAALLDAFCTRNAVAH